MASNLKKAGSVIRNSFRSKRYAMFDAKENNYILSPKKPEVKVKVNNGGRPKVRNVATTTARRSGSASGDEHDVSSLDGATSKSPQSKLRRTSSMTQSLRLAVGSLKQKLKRSSKRAQQQSTPKKTGTRNSSVGSQEIRLYSPFKIDTPSTAISRNRVKVTKTKNVSSANLETPTRLRREVESLTANMQALSALTPNTLHSRCRARKSSPYASRTTRTPRSTRKRIVLE